MKKLLSLLSVLTISGTAVPTTIAASPYQKEENIKNSDINYQQTNNLKKLNRSKRSDYSSFNLNLKSPIDFIKYLVLCTKNDSSLNAQNFSINVSLISSNIDNNINGFNVLSTAVFVPTESLPIQQEELLHSQITEFRAGNTNEDKALSGSFSYNVTDSFSYKFGEKISAKMTVSFAAGVKPFVSATSSFEIAGEFSSEQAWTKTTSYTLTAPSQWTHIKANHKKDVSFLVFKGKSLSKGYLKVKIDPNQKIMIATNQTSNDGNIGQYVGTKSILELINNVKNNGYSNLFNSNSLINLENNNLYLNIPTELESHSSRLLVNFGPEIKIN